MTIRPNNYLSIPAHARLTYDLSGNELLAYGLIHGFSQDGSSWYEGGQQYIADWCGISRRRVRDVLDRLLTIGAIEKKDIVVNNVTFCKYRVVLTEDEMSQGDRTKCPTPGEETSHNNISNNIEDNIVVEDNYSSRTINSTSKNNSTSTGKERKKKEYDLSFVNIAFEDVFKEWLEYKKSRNESYKDQHSLEVCYRRLLTLSNNDPHTAQLIIEEAIASNYKGFFELKQSKQSNYGNNSNQASGGFFCQLADSLKGSGGIH